MGEQEATHPRSLFAITDERTSSDDSRNQYGGEGQLLARRCGRRYFSGLAADGGKTQFENS